MSTAPRALKRGFTLVELLVVIGIIALLISILLPILNKARERANSIKCMAQQKTIMMAVIMYCGENKQTLPIPPAIGDTYQSYAKGDRRNSLMYYMMPDNSGAGVLDYKNGVFWSYILKGADKALSTAAPNKMLQTTMNCPSSAYDAYRWIFWGGNTGVKPRNFTYSWNIQMWGSSPGGGLPGNQCGIPAVYWTVVTKISQIKQSAHKILLVEELAANDGECWIQCKDDDDVPAIVHLGGSNCGFADGHSETLTPSQLGFIAGKSFQKATQDLSAQAQQKTRYYFSLRE